MFDLEKSIQRWLKLFRKYKAFNHGSIREMELHLRDHIDDLLAAGHSEQTAFEMAVKAFGDIKSMANEEYSNLQNPTTSTSFINIAMIRNYLKIALRNFRKQKSFTALNVIGLSIGMATGLLIFQYVKFERSFDSFHSRAKDIYRIQYNAWNNGQLNFESAVSVPSIATFLADNFPEVEAFTRFFPTDGVMSYNDPGQGLISFHEKKMLYADTSIFKVFDFELVNGNQTTCLKGVDKALISKSAALKYFGAEEAIGKIITRDGRRNFQITGIFKDVPENSHIKFDFLLSYETLNAMTDNHSESSWGWYDFYTFVLLKPNTNVAGLQSKLDQLLAETRGEFWRKRNFKQAFYLRPLLDIHLYSKLLYEPEPNEQRDGDSVHALSIIAVFILIIAWVNYVNLSTALSFNRANEVGVRKVMGAVRKQLLAQFLVESFLINLSASIVAMVIVRISWSYFSTLSGWHLPLSFIYQPDFWVQVVALFVLGIIFSGLYPAIILSSFKPAAVLKGKIIKSQKGGLLRKSLVVFQFASSVFLISSSIIVYQQLNYMKNKDLGIDIKETLVLNGPRATDSLGFSKLDAFKYELMKVPGVKGITASSNIPGDENYWTNGIERLSGEATSRQIVSTVAIDHDYVPSFDLQLLAGRNFDKDFPNDNKRILLNDALALSLQFKDAASAIGEKVNYGGDTLEITGVLQDHHQMSLKSDVMPTAYILVSRPSFIALKIETNSFQQILTSLEAPWKSYFPGDPMDYFFLDEFFNRQYEKDERFGQVFSLFTALAIFIACLGLVGLASYVTVQRTKEIGIRKVLGSTVPGIIVLLSKGFLQPVVLANFIAWPLTWFILEQWLQTFPYRVSINPVVFILSGLCIVAVSFISVGSQTLRAAFMQPANSLKYE